MSSLSLLGESSEDSGICGGGAMDGVTKRAPAWKMGCDVVTTLGVLGIGKVFDGF